MKNSIVFASALLCSSPAFAALQATATITSHPVGPYYEYDLTLNNIGTTTIGTFWFAWVPGLDFLPSFVQSETSPANWSPIQFFPAFGGDGYSIRWTTPAATVLPAGQSLSGFSFTTFDAPATVNGTSPVFSPFYQTRTSFVYIGAPEADPGAEFFPTVSGAPKPASLSVLGIAAGALFLRRRRINA